MQKKTEMMTKLAADVKAFDEFKGACNVELTELKQGLQGKAKENTEYLHEACTKIRRERKQETAEMKLALLTKL
jgi:hypothetical protein